jgi:asparagine synthase (glutamine-hydrolysing)
MCGIAGVIRHDATSVDPRLLDAMGDTLDHRGPEGRGTWLGSGPAQGIGLAHRRLRIIDVEHSDQPMFSADGRYVLVFNGEILNYRELRATLDYPWTSAGDTEVVLAAFAAHGQAAFAMLAGQFACAVVDTRTGQVWLARDRMGILPLYWMDDGRQLAFASEPKALAAVRGRLELDPLTLDEYLVHRVVSAPRTLYSGVSKLLPGTYAVLRARRPPHITPYWALTPRSPIQVTSPDEYVDHLDGALSSAVRRALVADVEVGTYLSGGLDSSLVTAITVAARPTGARTHTFAAGFGDARVDELPHARAVAAQLGTDHHEVHLREGDFEHLWPLLTWHRDAPLSEAADVAVYQLARVARGHVKVALSGEGSDELFGGYPKHAFAGLTSMLAHVPVSAREPVFERISRAVAPSLPRLAIALRALTGAGSDEMFAAWFASFTPAEAARLTGHPYHRHAAVPPSDVDALTRMLLQDCGSWLSDNLLERGDRMSMAASLELRPPFLDRDVVDLAFALPPSAKVSWGRSKWLVKQVARRYLPADVIDRRKIGFRVPLDAWLRGGLRDTVWDLLTDPDSVTTTMLDPQSVRKLLQEHDSGRRNHDMRLWTLASLAVWHRTCVLGGRRPASPPPCVETAA